MGGSIAENTPDFLSRGKLNRQFLRIFLFWHDRVAAPYVPSQRAPRLRACICRALKEEGSAGAR
jgi:hypothetical protein